MLLTDQRQRTFMRDWTTRRLASRTLLAYLVVAAFVLPGLRAAEPMTLEQVKAKLKAQRQKLRSFRVDYRIKAEPLVDVKLLGRWGMLHFYPYVREDHIAFKGDKQYWHKIDLPQKLTFKYVRPEVDPDAPADVQKQQREAKEAYERRLQEYAKLGAKGKAMRDAEEGMDSPGYDLMMGFNGKYAWSYDGTRKHRAVYDSPVQDLGFFQSEYLMSVGLRLEDRTMTPKMLRAMAQREYLLPDALDLHEYRVRPKTERVDGADCLVLEAKYQSPYLKDVKVVDRFWFDLDHGLALRRRDQVYDGRLGSRWLTFMLDEVVPGYWLPRETVWQRCAPPYAPKQYDNKPVTSYRMSVLRWSANDVKDELFEAPKEEKQQPAQPPAAPAGAVSIQVGDNVHVSAGRDSILHKEVVIAADPRNPKRLFAASMCQSTDRLSADNLAGWYSKDGGKTWHLSFERKGVKEESFADPAAAFGPDGVLYFVNMRRERRAQEEGSCLQIARSADGGKTWRDLARTDEPHDRPWLAVDRTGGRYNGRLYCNTDRGVLVSTDGGRCWGPPRFWKLPEGHRSYGPGNSVVLSDGAVVVLHRMTVPLTQVAGRMAAGSPNGFLTAHRSADGRETFDGGQKVAGLFQSLDARCGLPC